MARSTAGDNSERKRVSIPTVDESVLAWWGEQKDPSLSVRLLIRSEIERHGYTDTAYRPVAQLPRRGRPPAGAGEPVEFDPHDGEGVGKAVEAAGGRVHTLDEVSDPVATYDPLRPAQPAAASVAAPAPKPASTFAAAVGAARPEPPAQPAGHGGFQALDDLMNG